MWLNRGMDQWKGKNKNMKELRWRVKDGRTEGQTMMKAQTRRRKKMTIQQKKDVLNIFAA